MRVVLIDIDAKLRHRHSGDAVINPVTFRFILTVNEDTTHPVDKIVNISYQFQPIV
jgi:hypothetical protein